MKPCLPSHWNFIHNISHGVVARIVVAWDTSCFTITPVLVDAQCIACKVQQPQSPTCFYISVVYGFNRASNRRSLWSELRTLYGSIGNDAWLMLGDFNSVRTQAERVGSGSFDGLSTLDFNSCLEAIDMEDLASKGSWFTWSNRRGGMGFIKSRIDRALVNSKWQDQFPESEAVFQPPVHGNPMDVLSQKIRKLKSLLKDFNKEFYSDIHKRVALAHDELSILQTQCLALPYDVTLHESEKDALLKYTDLVAAEEDFNHQKSRVKWLALGDQNSKFFHKKVKSHVVRSKILSICDENGIRLDEPVAVKAEILGFYKKLLGEKFALKKDTAGVLNSLITSKVPEDMRVGLIQAVSDDEIKKCSILYRW
ncbi:hypothetical protein Vadar_008721 [Vaccinium darrowii]|uniref:Uncharacterized protein n=1 Tax=Vaccinium darrowii TaxID=229202 RepID=A0ACB7WYV5_9ERIC|nr:hypothetical protein Vadar_008721 [Vaccinium darrowii]